MGSKNKLKRFNENETFSNVIQPELLSVQNDTFHLKGKWKSDFFKNDHPIVLELGCGKGEYTIHLAEQNPYINYIGIDIKGARFWRGAKTALEKGLLIVNFCLVTRLQQLLKLEKSSMLITIYITIAMLLRRQRIFKLFMKNSFWIKTNPLLT